MNNKILMSEQPHVNINVNDWRILVSWIRGAEERLFVREHKTNGKRLIHGTVARADGEVYLYAGWLVDEQDATKRESETIRCVRRVAGRLAIKQPEVDTIIAQLPAINL